MYTLARRGWHKTATVALTLLASVAWAQEAPKSIRIGWAVAKTGPNAGGTAATVTPNYQMWVKEINAAGGLMLKAHNKRVPIEVVEYDDRSSSEEAVRATERLMTQDKVDFVLPPWGTANNLAVAPTYEKYKYPLLAVNSITDKAPELVKRWKHAFFFLGTGTQYAEALVRFLEEARKAGKIGDKVAMINVADGFGVELANAVRKVANKHGFVLVYDKSYPIGTQDMTPILSEAKSSNADVFMAFSYPPDTFMITDQSRVMGFNPKVMFLGVGSQFPQFKAKFGATAEGIMGPGGVDFDSPAIKDYFQRHKAFSGQEPDRFASTVQFAALQVLQQAIEKVGKVDRDAVTQEIKTGRFDTILGPIQLENQMFTKLWWVGQWQNGEFYGLAPSDKKGAKPALLPKPAWKN
ncbi:MAG: twin-arginine translocation pathway signal protein [Ideonella sp. MAG2]|nr:MAG: twin-arginine translocation pathway signal protein [Ideonella sp. MAG2]